MPSTLRLPALGADEHDRDGGYATFCLATLHKIDRRVRGILYSIDGAKSPNAVESYFVAKQVFSAIGHATKAAEARLDEERRTLLAAADLIDRGKTGKSGVDYGAPLMKKAIELRYHFRRVTDPEGQNRLRLRTRQVTKELRATAERCAKALNEHNQRRQKFADRMQLIQAKIEHLALKNGLFDDERYAYAGRTLNQCKQDASAIISKHVDDSGEPNA